MVDSRGQALRGHESERIIEGTIKKKTLKRRVLATFFNVFET